MTVEVIGEDISADAITEEAGCKTAGARRSRPRPREVDLANDIEARTSALGTGQQGAKSRNVKGKVIKAGRMPKLPKEEMKIVVRPQGGLDIVKVGAPTCNLCGGAHMTADKACKARFKTPYVIHRRRWERQQANNQTTQQDYPPLQPTRPRSRSRSRGRSRSHSRRTRIRGPTRSRSRTPAPGDKVSWADTTWGTAREGVGKALKVPEQNQTAGNGIKEALRKENSPMRELLQKLMHEVHELRRERAAAEQNKQPEQPNAQASVPSADAPHRLRRNGRSNSERVREVPRAR
ncbi:hypothetical protein HPB50_015344 [Hyalomma asiaticum]|uniref:Uncharacterized protein n=1 Tax=Hyalomma asiaticum TaxID=266040 RepID=A0ACB7SVT7_HYAAI|nr:hypothetical protein HPB50_015344 [Hyalomma asiaticum]